MTSVAVRSVSKHYGPVKALDNLSLHIQSGDLFFLLGPSGCGKSTLLRIIAGLERCDTGSILFNDQDVSNVPSEKRQIGMVFQNYALWPHLTVAENVLFPLECRNLFAGEQAERARAALALVQCETLASRFPSQLSGGQQQRVALARAIVAEPVLLLLDEPLSNLDARLRDELREQIRKLHARLKITTIFVTHDQSEALSLASRILVMQSGHTEQLGTPEELYFRPKNRFVASFIGDAAIIEGTKTSLRTVQTALGELTLASDAGDQLSRICVRPEQLRVSTDGPGAEASVQAVLFEGGHRTLVLRIGDLDLTARASALGAVTAGERVKVTVEGAVTAVLE